MQNEERYSEKYKGYKGYFPALRSLRVRLVAYDYLSSSQRHRSLILPDPNSTPLASIALSSYATTRFSSLSTPRKRLPRRVVLVYNQYDLPSH